MLGAALAVSALFTLNCSKKASTPTAPPNPQPSCSVSATSLDFGSVLVGSNADRSFTISNNGGGTLTGTATTSSAGYAVIGGASYSLVASQQATVTVRFSPTTTGTLPGAIGLSGTGCGSVSCTGAGQQTGPICRLSTRVLSFGTVTLGACGLGDRTFTISNVGTGTLSGTVVPMCPAFQVIGHSTYSLGSGGSDTFTIRFAPTTSGDQSCRVVTGCDTVYCDGQTESPAGCASLSPTSLDFGTAYIGQTVTKTFTLRAGGSQFDLIWAGDGDPNFSGPPPQLGVQPGDIISFPIHFTPQSAGPQSSWAQGQCKYVIGDGQYHAFGCVTVSGVGQVAAGTPTCGLSATSLDFGSIRVGSHLDRTLTVTNTGGGVLNGSVAPTGCPEYAVLEDPTVSLGPGQSSTYTIRFSPSQAGHAYTCYSFVSDPHCQLVTFTGQGQ
jgi:hypothetical protein